MSLLTKNSTPAERLRGCVFSETFESAQAVVQNGATIVGAPVINRGAVFDGINDYIDYPGNGIYENHPNISIILEFTPYFDTDIDITMFLLDSENTSRYRVFKGDNGLSNIINQRLGDTSIDNVAQATYSPYWLANQRNVLIISGTSGNTSTWLNGHVITDADPTLWSPGNPSYIRLGAINTGIPSFSGVFHSVKIFNQLLNAQEALDYYNNETYTYENDSSLHLPMGMAQHDPANVRTLDLSGNDRHATFGDGVTPAEYPTKIARHHGYDLDGGDHFRAVGTGIFNASEYTVALEFTADFPYDIDSSIYLMDASADARYFMIKYNAAFVYILSVRIGSGQYNIPAANYGPEWTEGRRNLLVISADGTTFNAWLGGRLVATTALAFTGANPDVLTIGSSAGGASNFDGQMHSFRVWQKALTPLQIHDLTVRTLGKVNDV